MKKMKVIIKFDVASPYLEEVDEQAFSNSFRYAMDKISGEGADMRLPYPVEQIIDGMDKILKFSFHSALADKNPDKVGECMAKAQSIGCPSIEYAIEVEKEEVEKEEETEKEEPEA